MERANAGPAGMEKHTDTTGMDLLESRRGGYVKNWSRKAYYGDFLAGVALGTIIGVAVAGSAPASPSSDLAGIGPTHRDREVTGTIAIEVSLVRGAACRCGSARAKDAAYFIVIASPLRSAFAISPTCRPDSSRTAPFWLVRTISRTPSPNARPAPAAA